MPPAPSPSAPDSRTLDGNQVKLMIAVINALPQLKSHEWNQIAAEIGATNGKAAHERFRYLMRSLKGEPQKNSRIKATQAIPTPPATPKSASMVSSRTASKKRKQVAREEDADKDDMSTPLSKKSKRSAMPVKMEYDDKEVEEVEEEEDEELEIQAATTVPGYDMTIPPAHRQVSTAGDFQTPLSATTTAVFNDTNHTADYNSFFEDEMAKYTYEGDL